MTPTDLVQAAKACDMSALGLTDHHLLTGTIEFVKACKEAEIQPILGLEIALDQGSLQLLATSAEGWSNLCRLSSVLALRDNPDAPCLLETLFQYSKDLIALCDNPHRLQDGFESNDLTAWGWASTGGGNLSVSTQAAGIGQYGLQAVIDNTNNMALYDSSPVDAKHINTRFYFDPNSVQITSKDGFYPFAESSGAGWVACVYFEQQGQYYSLSLCGVDDSGTWHENSSVLIADARQAIEVEWKAATAPGANNGFIKLYVGDQLVSSLENFDNDTQSITETTIQVDDNFTGNGTIYFDGYKTVVGSHIGLDPNGPSVSAPPARPDAMFEDDFESGNLSKWHPGLTVTEGGDLSVSANAAYQSGFGLQTLIDDTTVIKALDLSPVADSHYRAGSISIPIPSP